MADRKAIQIDLNTYNRLKKYCDENKYYVGGWVAKLINETLGKAIPKKTKK